MSSDSSPAHTAADPPATTRHAPSDLTADQAIAIVESSPGGVVVVREDGVVRYANGAASSLFGYPDGGLAGRPVDDLVPRRPTSRRVRLGATSSRGSRPLLVGQDRRVVARRPDASEVVVDVRLVSLGEAAGSTTAVFVGAVPPAAEDEAARAALLAADRERMASELGERVVRRLFHTGMALQSVLKLTDGTVREHLDAAVEELDAVVRDLRAVAFDEPLRSPASGVADKASPGQAAAGAATGPPSARPGSGLVADTPSVVVDGPHGALGRVVGTVARSDRPARSGPSGDNGPSDPGPGTPSA